MCLRTDNLDGLKSDKPIICYKRYIRRYKKYVSPVMDMEYCLSPDDEVIAEGRVDPRPRSLTYGEWMIGIGAIHAYQRYERAVSTAMFNIKAGLLYEFESALRLEDFNGADRILDELIRELNESCVICKMEIPAGETYWEGNDNDICSRRLIFKEEIGFTEEILLNTLYAWASGCSYTVICEYLRHKKNKK